jgi:hypothetical protein
MWEDFLSSFGTEGFFRRVSGWFVSHLKGLNDHLVKIQKSKHKSQNKML